MVIKIKKSEFDLVIEELSKSRSDLAEKLEKAAKDYTIVMNLEEEVIDDIKDCIDEEIQRSGYDIDYELTSKGKDLQTISDKLLI